MKKVSVLAAAFANPSGGFVHNDMTKETSKVLKEVMDNKEAEQKKANQNKTAMAAILAARHRNGR
jgi:translation initiation factor 6 (eIF-6)